MRLTQHEDGRFLTENEQICRLNDRFRRTFVGGIVVITAGVRELGPGGEAALRSKVQLFEGFDPNDDPYSEHDFGTIKQAGETWFWKIDYFDPTMNVLSRDPADPGQTLRVLTILHANEY